MIVLSKHDPFGVERELRERYGDKLLDECHRYEVDAPVGDVVSVRLHLFLHRDTEKS